MISVRCLLCLNKSTDQLEKLAAQESWGDEKLQVKLETLSKNTAYEIRSKLIAKNDMEAMQALGMELLNHMQSIHREECERIPMLAVHFNGFNVMKYFESETPESLFEKEKESMRDKLVEEVMWGAPDDEDDFLEDEEEGEDNCDDEFEFDDEDGDEEGEDDEKEEGLELTTKIGIKTVN